jgi:hypothetical protein
MHFDHFLSWLADTGFSNMIRGSLWAEPIIETVHVLTLTMFFGFTMMLDLRLMGVFLVRRPVSNVLAQINPWLFASFTVMFVSGILLFCGDPVSFWATFPFKAKMVMLLLAGLNTLIFSVTVGKRAAAWDLDPVTPTGAKFAAVISIVLWVAIIAAGRAIAYLLPPPI